MRDSQFDPTTLSPCAKEGYAEPRFAEYLTHGTESKNPRTLTTYCIEMGSLRRIGRRAKAYLVAVYTAED